MATSSSWKAARNRYYGDQYTFKGFESLHILSILSYQRELSKISYELVEKKDEDIPEEKLSQVRKLLSGHGK
jgi:hypothetical protein